MFAIEVPVSQARPRPQQSRPDGTASVTFEGNAGTRVLLIENAREVLAATRQLLESLGLKVTAVPGYGEALAQVEAGFRPEFVIVNYRLDEGASGVAVIEQLRGMLGGHLAALLISGDTLPESVRAMQASAFRMLQKPVAPDQLVKALNAVLGAGGTPGDPG
jgi:DNA-binding NtrC family response regulator